MMLAARFQWYALMVKPGTEFDVEALLNAAHILAVVPVRREWRKVNSYVRRKQQVCYSVLPRYVLVGFGGTDASNYEDEVRAIARIMRELTLVQSVVGMEGMPRRMNALRVAEFLRDLGEIDAPKWQRHMKTGREFEVGDQVEVLSGPFSGQVVRVDEIKGRYASVLLPLFGEAEHSVRVPIAKLVKSA